MIDRLGHVLLAFGRAIDILLCVVWLGPLYLVGLASRPSGRQMISSYVGEAAYNGHRWGRRAAAVIDWTFEKLGDGPNHCHRAFVNYQFFDD